MHFFVYMYQFENGWVYIGRSREGVNRFNNPKCYMSNKRLYEAMTTQKYEASIVFESDNIWDVGWVESYLINTYPNKYNINSELDWKRHIRTYIKQYKSKFDKLGWVVEDEYNTYEPSSSLKDAVLKAVLASII